jgi:hypothetical protein
VTAVISPAPKSAAKITDIEVTPVVVGHLINERAGRQISTPEGEEMLRGVEGDRGTVVAQDTESRA